MRRIKVWLLTAIAGTLLCHPLVCIAGSRPRVDRIVGARGIFVVLGDTNCELALELARNPAFAGLNMSSYHGQRMWKRHLVVDRDGRIVVTLEDGQVLCFG